MIRRAFSTGGRYLTDPVADMEDEVSKCINCGFCESVCPTLPSAGFVASHGARGRVDLGLSLVNEIRTGKRSLRVSDPFYSCLDCFACLQVCPAGVNAGKVSHLAREIIAETDLVLPQEKDLAAMIVSVTMEKMNPLGLRRECARWSSGLSFSKNSTTLLYTGNMYQLMPYSFALGRAGKILGEEAFVSVSRFIRKHPDIAGITAFMKNVPMEKDVNLYLRSIYALLRKAGISFQYLGEEEPYPGTFIYDLGYINEFSIYAERVTDIFRRRNVTEIITIDPHTYDLLKNQYPRYVKGFDFDVRYYAEYLQNLEFRKTGERVTFHEPCHFVLRDVKDFDLKRMIGNVSKMELPERSGKRVMCCGGPAELLFPDISKNVSDERFRQLKATGTESIITACPVCFSNLKKDDSVEDVSSFLLRHLM